MTTFFKTLILKLMGRVLPILILIAVVLIIGFVIIQRSPYKNDVPSAKQKIEAVYTGTIPCADCPGINEKITFYSDKTYADENVYQERDTSYINKGTWSLNGTIYQLTNTESGNSNYYQIQGEKIVPLDPDTKKPIPSPLNLSLTRQPQ